MALFEFGDYSYQEITLKEKLLEEIFADQRCLNML